MKTKIALCPFNPYPGELEKNAQNIANTILQSKNLGADIAVFPEMSIPGYCLGDLHKNRSFIEKQKEVLHRIILPTTKDITVILGMTIQDSSLKMSDGTTARFNGFAVLSNQKIIRFGKKTLLVDEGVLEDSRYFLLGDQKEINPIEITLKNQEKIKLGVLVCQDMWDDHSTIHPASILAQKGADLLVTINSSPFYAGKSSIRRQIALNRVTETGLPLVYVNASGIQDIGKNIVIFDGDSFAITTKGLVENKCFEDQIKLVDFDISSLNTHPNIHIKTPDEISITSTALIYTLQHFFKRTKVFNGAVTGLSGGIDSALDALLLYKALGKDKLLAINMPSRYNSSTTKNIAAQIAENLGIKYIIHPIQEIINIETSIFKESSFIKPKQLTVENMQARIRGSILMTYSQEYGYMVVGNGNKTEFQRGYATLYGDILGAIMPLGDVHKLKVYELADHLDPNRQIFPDELFTIKPSAELSEAHNITKGGGDPFDYFVEAPIGVELIENGLTPEDLQQKFIKKTLDSTLWKPDLKGFTVYDKFNKDEFHNYAIQVLKAIRSSYFKRVQAPPIPVVSKRAFGLDYRESLFLPHSV